MINLVENISTSKSFYICKNKSLKNNQQSALGKVNKISQLITITYPVIPLLLKDYFPLLRNYIGYFLSRKSSSKTGFLNLWFIELFYAKNKNSSSKFCFILKHF